MAAIDVTNGSLLRLVIQPGKGNPAKGEGAHWWDSTFTEVSVRAKDGTQWDLRDAILDGQVKVRHAALLIATGD